jgi:putative ABC transport system permease protein
MLRGRITRLKGVPADKVKVSPDAEWVLQGDRGITWAPLPPKGTKLVQGKWWAPDYSGRLLVSFDAESAAGLGLSIGDSVTSMSLAAN